MFLGWPAWIRTSIALALGGLRTAWVQLTQEILDTAKIAWTHAGHHKRALGSFGPSQATKKTTSKSQRAILGSQAIWGSSQGLRASQDTSEKARHDKNGGVLNRSN